MQPITSVILAASPCIVTLVLFSVMLYLDDKQRKEDKNLDI
jgi:hypothetical protein